MSFVLGMDGQLSIGLAIADNTILDYTLDGTYTIIVGNATDVTPSLEKATADVTTRGNDGWRATVGTLRTLKVEFKMLWDTADAAFVQISKAFFDKTAPVLPVRVLDKASGKGFAFYGSVTSFSKEEPLEQAQMVSVVLEPTYSPLKPPIRVGF